MVEGDKWELYIPPDLGYGDKGSGDKIKGGDVLIFRMELLKIKGGKRRIAKCNFKTRENCEPQEAELLEGWADKSVEELKQGLAAVRAQKDDATADHEARENAKENLLFMMQIMKAKRKNEL
mmetsp:Transcript_10608/g.31913  ORF Transcript_10608/g.31913 Transcript_10608/m.31913 type:complete len:122 (+) Transcript_10608:1-366(+)